MNILVIFIVLTMHDKLAVGFSYLLTPAVNAQGPQIHTSVLCCSSLSLGRLFLINEQLIRPLIPPHWLSFVSERTWTTSNLLIKKQVELEKVFPAY